MSALQKGRTSSATFQAPTFSSSTIEQNYNSLIRNGLSNMNTAASLSITVSV